MANLLTINQLSVQYQQVTALQDVNLTLPTGQRIAIIGPNGAGKSTLLQASLGLVKSTGEIKVFDQAIDKVRHMTAYVPQRANVNWQFPTTVKDVVLMGITSKKWGFHRYTAEQKELAYSAIETMQLTDLMNRQIDQLSGGQKQRVFLARAIAQNAQAYFLDEPLAGVDQTSERLIMDQLEQFKKDGKSSVTVHHQLETIDDYFDYIVMINKTVIVAGPISQVLTQDNINQTYLGMTKNKWEQ